MFEVGYKFSENLLVGLRFSLWLQLSAISSYFLNKTAILLRQDWKTNSSDIRLVQNWQITRVILDFILEWNDITWGTWHFHKSHIILEFNIVIVISFRKTTYFQGNSRKVLIFLFSEFYYIFIMHIVYQNLFFLSSCCCLIAISTMKM